MSNEVIRSIFHTTVAERSWKTKVTSTAVHAVVIGAAFLISFPVVEQLKNPASEHVTLIAPSIPHLHPTIELPRLRRVANQPKPVIPPAIVKPPDVAKIIPPPIIPTKPALAPVTPQPKIVAETKPEMAPAPKPVVKTGSFEDLQTAKAAATRQVIVGGFGDPRGVQSADTPRPQPVLMAKVGSFESPNGSGQTGGGGHLDSGVRQSGFGNVGNVNAAANSKAVSGVRTANFGDGALGGTGHTANGAVRSTGFGDTLAAAPQHKDLPASVPAFTPVEILFKPRPSYSEEARGMRLEGQVSLEVVFQASGAVKVVRIIKGLGHGLDEAAQQAALQVRFKPATKAGAPVDTSATISITFELT